jgi:hypothetical protein
MQLCGAKQDFCAGLFCDGGGEFTVRGDHDSSEAGGQCRFDSPVDERFRTERLDVFVWD